MPSCNPVCICCFLLQFQSSFRGLCAFLFLRPPAAAFSPIGEAFRSRLRMFPALVNCCTIDWFSAWPESRVSATFYKQVPLLVYKCFPQQFFSGFRQRQDLDTSTISIVHCPPYAPYFSPFAPFLGQQSSLWSVVAILGGLVRRAQYFAGNVLFRIYSCKALACQRGLDLRFHECAGQTSLLADFSLFFLTFVCVSLEVFFLRHSNND